MNIDWVLVGDGPEDKYHREGWDNTFSRFAIAEVIDIDATYELVGPKVQGNPDGYDKHVLVQHGSIELPWPPKTDRDLLDADFDGIRSFLENHEWEGIVWWHDDGRKAKIKRRDFGLSWPVKR